MKDNKMLCMLGLGVIVLLLCCVKSYNNVERFEEESDYEPSWFEENIAWVLLVSIMVFFLLWFIWDKVMLSFKFKTRRY